MTATGIADEPPGPSTDVAGFAVIDVETSGLDAKTDRVVEIALLRADGRGNAVDEWTTLVNPGEARVGPTRVHGITAADVRTAPAFAELVGELNRRLSGRALVAHGAAFDLEFLASEYQRLGWEFPTDLPHLCTLKASLTYQPRLRRRRLRDCCRAAGLSMGRGHSALGDARAAAWLLRAYLQRADPAHLKLAADARLVMWPSIPVTAVRPVGRAGSRDHHNPSAAHTRADTPMLPDAVHDIAEVAGRQQGRGHRTRGVEGVPGGLRRADRTAR